MIPIPTSTSHKKIAILFVVGITSVLPTLWGDFVFDDGEAIVKNSDVVAPGSENFYNIFKHDFWGVNITHKLSHKSYRPFTTISYRLDYYLWGHNPFPFHLLDLVLHGVNCSLVFLFLNKCIHFQTKCESESSKFMLPKSKWESVAFWSALLFSVHPVHVEPLGAIVGRADLISSFVFLAAFCFIKNDTFPGTLLLSVCSVVGALFKENAISLSVFLIFYDLYTTTTQTQVNQNPNLKRSAVKRCCLIIAIASGFVIWRLWLQEGPPVFQPYDNPPAFAPTISIRTVNILYIWVLNAFILLNPIWLCYDWSMGCVRLIDNLWDVRILIVLVFLLLCLRVAYMALALKNRLIMTAVIIFISTFLPSSNLLFTVGFVLAERNMYLPSIGYCLFIAFVFIRRNQKKILLFVIVTFYLRSLQRSFDWVSQRSLFMSALSVCPDNAKIHYNLGTMYGEAGDHVAAEKSYKAAISLRPDYYQAMNNLGNLLRINDKLQEAESWLRQAVEIKQDFAAAWMNLGIILSNANQTEALRCYQNALKFRKSYPDCEYNLGNLYLDLGNKEAALQAWRRATSMKPTHSQAWINSVILLEQEGKLTEAKDTATEALKILTADDTLHFILGNILGKLSEFESAKSSFKKAIELCIEFKKQIPAKYFSNLGVLYHRWGKKDEAIRAYKKAMLIDPHSASTRKNLEMLLKSKLVKQ